MKKIYIVGGDGFARECYLFLKTMIKNDDSISFGGFWGHGGYGHTVDYKNLQEFYLGEVSDHQFQDNEYVVIGAGYPGLRRKIYEELKERKIKFFNLILNSFIGESVNMGEANIILASSITENVFIGNGNVMNGYIAIAHDVKIGDCNFFGPRSQLLGGAKIGNHNQIGANAIVLPHAKIGNNNIIAPLSAVYKGCKNNCYMLGNPALKVGEVENE